MHRLLTIAALAVAFPAQAADAPRCADIAVPGLAHCRDGARGVVLGETADGLDGDLAAVEAGAAAFARRFGVETPPWAVVVGDLTGERLDALKRLGFAAILPWMTDAALVELLTASVRERLAEQARSSGLPPETVADRAADAERRIVDQVVGRRAGVLAHEMGHVWFIAAYWPRFEPGGPEIHYGGPAPDWLDETAAVILEDDALTAARRAAFRKAVRREDGLEPAPLDRFLAMEHPFKAFAAAHPELFETPDDGSARVMIAQGDGETAAAANAFYAQCRAFADFLFEATGDAQVFGRIARAYASGGDFAGWLAAEGAALGLPAGVDALAARFEDWSRTAYADPSAP